MVFRPEIFLSATPTELDPYREAAKEALREMGARAVEHTDLSIPYGPLDGVLNVTIRQCDAVVHVTGFIFGPEPSERVLGSPRRSFGHFELDIAKALKKNTFAFIAAPGTPTNPTPREDDEARMLQSDHRRALERGEHWTFSSPEDLVQALRSLRPRLMVRRRFIRIPFPAMGPALVGRERPLAELRQALETERLVVIRPPTSHASTSSSAGKTALAVEAAWQLYEAGRFDHVIWLAGSSRVELEAGLAALARADALSLMQEEVTDHHVRLHVVRQWLRAPEREGRILVLIDGVDQEAQWLAVHSILPWLDRGTVLITSRLTLAWNDMRTIELGAMPVDAATKLLLPSSGREPTHAQRLAAERLAIALGWQPLALRLTALALSTFEQTPERLLGELEAEAGERSMNSATQGVRWLTNVAKVIRLILSRCERAQISLLQILVTFAPQPAAIPLGIVSGRPDADKLRVIVTQLDRVGLLTLADGGHSIFIHRTVREIVRDRMTPTEQATALDAGRALIESAFPRSGRAGATATQRERLVPHCRVVLGQLNGHPLEVHAAKLASGLASWLRDCGRLSEAEHFQRKALHIVEKSCVPDHPDLVPELRLLAQILRDQHRYGDAVTLHQRAISILEKHPGEMREVTTELYLLASCLRGAQRLREAEPVLRKALALEERSSGPNHPRTAIAAHTLAGLLEAAHRPDEALPLYRRALEIDEGATLSTPAKVALRLQHVAGALASCGQRDEAIEMQRRALALEESAFGRSNPELITPLKQLAALLEQEHLAREAEGIYRRALALEETNPAVPPLEIAATLTGLASVLAAQEDFSNASVMAKRALSILADRSIPHPLARALVTECESLLKG